MRTQKGFAMVSAIFSIALVTLVFVPITYLLMDTVSVSRVNKDIDNLSAIQLSAMDALRLNTTFPPCGATTTTPGNCSIPSHVLPADLSGKGYTITAQAQSVTFDPNGLAATVASGTAYQITGTVKSPTSAQRTFTVLVVSP